MLAIDLSPLALSLQVSVVATAACVVLGTSLAWALSRRRFRGRSAVQALVTVPLVLPPTVLGYYLLLALGRRSAVGSFMEESFGVSVAFSWVGAAIASAVVAFPLMVLTAQAAMEGVNPALEQVARTVGRSNFAVFVTITLPLAWRGLLAATVLTFARAMGEFGATVMVAGNIPGKTQTMAIAVFDAWEAGDTARANALAAILVAATIVPIFCVILLTRPRRQL